MYFCCGITEQGIMPHNEDALMIAGSVRDSGASAEYVKAPFIAAVSDGKTDCFSPSALVK